MIKGASVLLGGASVIPKTGLAASARYRMPEESEPHARTWMAFVAREDIWSRRQVPAVKRDLALIATTIAGYEPVSVLVSAADRAQARQLIPVGRSRYPIELVEFDTDDLWLRDTGPTFVRDRHGVTAAVDFNFNGWGGKQAHARDAQVAAFVSDRAGVPRVTTDLVLEGGCFEVDGDGTAIMTRSCILNSGCSVWRRSFGSMASPARTLPMAILISMRVSCGRVKSLQAVTPMRDLRIMR